MAKSGLLHELEPIRLPAVGSLMRLGWRRCRELGVAQLGSVFGVLLVLCSTLWALGEYTSYKAQLRTAETGRYVSAFAAGPVADAWHRLGRAWQVEQERQDVLLARLALSPRVTETEALQNYRLFVLETIADHGLDQDVEMVRQFYRRLALCIRTDSCQRSFALARLGEQGWRFRNQHYYYLKQNHAIDTIDGDLGSIFPRQHLASVNSRGIL